VDVSIWRSSTYTLAFRLKGFDVVSSTYIMSSFIVANGVGTLPVIEECARFLCVRKGFGMIRKQVGDGVSLGKDSCIQ
jgi:hypothetical protein